MKWRTKADFQPRLKTIIAVPYDTFEEGVNQTHYQQRGAQLRSKLGALGNAAGDNSRDGCSKGHQKEELDQRIAIILGQGRCISKEIGAVGNPVTNEEICQARNGKITDDFR